MQMLDELINTLKNLDYSPLYISLVTGVVSAIISFFLGIWIAFVVYCRSSKSKAIWDGILTLPMVLPPTVAGFMLLIVFSKRRPFGAFLYNVFNVQVVQTFLGCVIAATVIALPIMYQNARGAFEQVDMDLVYAARTLGMSDWQILNKVLIPTAKPGIYSGLVLCFARAMGEYGATSMLAGNIPQKTATVSQRIAMVVQDGDYITAGIWVFIILIISLIIISTSTLLIRDKRYK